MSDRRVGPALLDTARLGTSGLRGIVDGIPAMRAALMRECDLVSEYLPFANFKRARKRFERACVELAENYTETVAFIKRETDPPAKSIEYSLMEYLDARVKLSLLIELTVQQGSAKTFALVVHELKGGYAGRFDATSEGDVTVYAVQRRTVVQPE